MQTETRPMPPPPMRPPPPSSQPQVQAQAQAAAVPATFAVSRGRIVGRPMRTVIYGSGGVGKTTLASFAESPVFLELEPGSGELDVARITGISKYEEVRSILQNGLVKEFKTIVLDSVTKLEEMTVNYIMRTVPTQNGSLPRRIEDYDYGKGYQHAYDMFLPILADLDRCVERGHNVVLIAHECVSNVPNPGGEDWIRYEPHLQNPRSGKASIRERVFQWADNVLFVGFNVAVTEEGKGFGSGERVIWLEERPTHRAKMRGRLERGLGESLPFTDPNVHGPALWSALSAKKEGEAQ